MANKISVVLDVATDKAISGLKGFKQSVAEADGAFGKIKAGGASAFDSIKANAGIAGVAVVGAVGAMAAKSIEAASKLGESVNAVNVTFGQSAAGIKALGEEAAESVGLSNSAFNGLAVQFSSFATTIAGEGGNVVSTIGEMTTRAADFASVMNIDVADAASIFQSGLAGETEPLKKFGIDLSAAAVEAYALSKGIVTAGETMTEAQKVQARYGLLMEQTDKTSGDFANTSDGLANSQRILAAKMEDTAAKVGKDLAPALAIVTTVLSDMIPVAGTVATQLGQKFTYIADSAYALGQSIADMWEALPFTEAPEMVGPTLYEWQKLEMATADLVAKFAEGAPTMEEFVAAMVEAGVSTSRQALAIIEYRKQLDGVHDSTGAVTEATVEETEAVKSLKEEMEGGIDVNDLAEQSAQALADQAERTREAFEAQTEAIEDQVEATTALVGGDIAVRDAQREAAAAVAELTAAHVAGTPELDSAATAMINAATAAADYDTDLAAANGTVLTAQGKQDLLRQKLEELAGTLAPGSPLRLQIEGYIADLNAIPAEVSTSIEIRAFGGGATIGLLGTQGGPRAAGGPVSAGVAYPVGEQGPELFMPSSNGTIIPNGALGLGGATLNFYSNGPPTIADLSYALTMLRLSR